MTAGEARRGILREMLAVVGLEPSEADLTSVADVHSMFSNQRARLSGAARPETEPMTIPAFEHAWRRREARHEQSGE